MKTLVVNLDHNFVKALANAKKISLYTGERTETQAGLAEFEDTLDQFADVMDVSVEGLSVEELLASSAAESVLKANVTKHLL